MQKIYTKIGDQGHTSLATGERVSKSSLRIASYGTVDELNAFIGLLGDDGHVFFNADQKKLHLWQGLSTQLTRIQNELFDLGSELASPGIERQKICPEPISEKNVLALEKEMDQWSKDLSPLKNFILPGGHPLVSRAHVCRVICRRAERQLVELYTHSKDSDLELLIKYLNRLSDWFFISARTLSTLTQTEEVLWQKTRTTY